MSVPEFLTYVAGAGLGYTWGGYPVAIWLVSRLRRRAAMPLPSGDLPRVTVVIATREAREGVERRVANLQRGDYPRDRLEVVVAVDGRTDAAALLPLTTDSVRVVPGDSPGGKAAALNAAVRAASGEVLVFSDTAQEFAPDAIRTLVAALTSDDRLAAVSGSLVLEGSTKARSAVSWYWSYERWIRRAEARWHSPVGVTGAIYAMWSRLWVPIPPNLILDDLYVPMLQVLRGRRIGFSATAIAMDKRVFDAAGESRRKTRTLTGVYQLCALLPEVLRPTRNPVWFQFVSHKLLRLVTPHLLLVGVAGATWWTLSAMPVETALVVSGVTAGLVATSLAASRRLRSVVAEVVAMLGALTSASRNAVRGNWDVW